MNAKNLEVYLICRTAESYCVRYVNEPGDAIGKATHRLTNGSIWLLSKPIFDAQTAFAYICTPVPFRIDLTKSKLDPCGRADPAMNGA